MERTLVCKLREKIGESVKIDVWIETIRNQGSIGFLLVRDISGKVQIVVSKSNKQVFDVIEKVTPESVIEVEGLVKEEKQAPGGFEIEPKKIKILSLSSPELPIQVLEKNEKEASMEKRFNWRFLDLRKPEKQLIFKIWTSLEKGMREYFEKEDFMQIYTPSLMNTASESGSEVFEVKYFKKKAYLAQSPQFYKQAAMAAGMEKVFIVGPVYRAEPSFTTRHTTEYTSWDFEISFIESHLEIMEVQEKLLVSAFKKVKEEQGIDFDIPTIPFPKVTMKEAKGKLKTKGIKSEKDYDVSPKEERELSKIIKEETGHDFVFLTDWPKEGRAFYHMRYEDKPDITKSFDLLYKGIEITTGAQREHRVEILEKQAKEKKIPLNTIENYLNFFKFGCPPHGGLAMGPARLVMKMLDLPTVKEANFLPRDVKRLTP
ncbi:aspartate--tRNA(Asn) ligase [Patescibacteria group bacterium]|nr:aspartate--tRNA(Asn) ligase [Patescibacteria group bacterium]MBU2036011.1 aspartate--tRNA(Asn) ligase [Patescibacteria group bacterium]